MARQTSLQVTTPELTFFLLLSLTGPQTIVIVFGHLIWLCNGLMKSLYDRKRSIPIKFTQIAFSSGGFLTLASRVY